MKVFKLTDKLKSIKEIDFKLEKDIQNLVESNLEELLGLSFIESEYSIKDYRFDTVCFNFELNSFIIIEYKMGKSGSVVDQGYAYLSTLLEYKANLVLLYNARFNASKQIKDFNWNETRICFISSKFTKYQTDATSFADMPFNLFEIKRFDNGIILFEEINKNDKISTKEINTNLNSIIEEVNKEIIVYTENHHLDNKNDIVLELYSELKERLLELGEISLEFKKKYISFKSEIPLCQVVIMATKLKVFINSKYLDELFLKENTLKLRDVSNIGHWGTLNHEFIAENLEDVEDLIFYVRKILINSNKFL